MTFTLRICSVWAVHGLVILTLLMFSGSAEAKKKKEPVTENNCTYLAVSWVSAPDRKVVDTPTRTACCSKSLGFCIVVPKSRSKNCTKHPYSVNPRRLPRMRGAVAPVRTRTEKPRKPVKTLTPLKRK